MNTYQRVEIYTANPENPLIKGWDIEFILVKAQGRNEAREKLKKYPLFDCVITWEGYETINSNEDFIKP
jgi:hypothetical protein